MNKGIWKLNGAINFKDGIPSMNFYEFCKNGINGKIDFLIMIAIKMSHASSYFLDFAYFL